MRAQDLSDYTNSYVTPFPKGDQYELVVFGDSLGDGIWSGLYHAFKPDTNIEVVKKSKVSTGFVRTDYYDWNAQLGQILKTQRVNLAVVMVGANDTQAIRTRQGHYAVGSDGWRAVYGARVEKFIRQLKNADAAIYWVGLPIMRSADVNRDMQVMNEIFREKAFVAGVKFIDTFNGFTDQFGNFSAYGPDIDGKVTKLRAGDGIHFTMDGYRKLAQFVEREIRRDMQVAKLERNIPLAGGPEEQSEAVRHESSSEVSKTPAPVARADADKAPPKTVDGEGANVNESAKQGKDVAGVDLVRPKLEKSEVAAAQDASHAYTPVGETIASDLGNGLTALSSISPLNESSLIAQTRNMPLAQRPYYKVLIKGEPVRPKEGRADDFSWPHG